MNVTTANPIANPIAYQQNVAVNQPNDDQHKPYVRIVEQPARAALRFRYQCEGRSAGSLPGASSTNEKKTWPTIEIVNFHGKALVVVSCVTINAPYRPHPHQLVGKDGCRKGICSLIISNSLMRYQFESLGIQCVRKRDIVESLQLRESLNVDPFKTGFAHKKEFSQFIDLNAVRLCFEVYLEDKQHNARVPLQPIVSEIIYDKKTMADLCIYEISHTFASVSNQQKVIILCNCVLKDNIEVRFYELDANGQVVWEDNAQFLPRNVYKQTAISFKIPKYRLDQISQPVECYVQLRRKSDGHTSPAKKFYYLPDSAYQPINHLIKSLSIGLTNPNLTTNHFTNSYGNLANYGLASWSSLGSGLANSFPSSFPNGFPNSLPNSFVPSGFGHSPATYSLMANNLANCLSTSNLSPNLVSNLAIPSLPPSMMNGQQPLSTGHLTPASSTVSTPLNGKKRPRTDSSTAPQYHPNAAYGLHAKRNCLNKNALLPPAYQNSNQIILNSFNPSGTHTLANTLIDLDNLQQFSGSQMLPHHLPVSSGAFSMPATHTSANANSSRSVVVHNSLNRTLPNSSFSSTNTSLNQSGQELQIEPTYTDFKNQFYHSQMARDELNQRENAVS